jgi:hypothetical protein
MGPFGLLFAPLTLAAGLLGATVGVAAAPFGAAAYYGDPWYGDSYIVSDAGYWGPSVGFGYGGTYIAKYKGKVRKTHHK